MTRKLPVPISKEDFEKILAFAVKEREKYKWKRSGVLKPRGVRIQEYIMAMCLGYGSGMRISEIIGHRGVHIKKIYDKEDKKKVIERKSIPIEIPKLTADKIDSDSKSIRVVGGKGGKDRIVPYPLKVINKAGITHKEFIRNLPLQSDRRSIQRYITETGMVVLKKHITFHSLRHTFGSLLAQVKPLHEVQLLMGHSRLDTTGIYLHVNPKKALEGVDNVF